MFTVTVRHLKVALAGLLAVLLVIWLSSCIGRSSTAPVAQQAQQPYAYAPQPEVAPQAPPVVYAAPPQPQVVYAPAPQANSGLHDMVTGALLGHVLTNAFSNRGYSGGGGGGDSTINRTVVNKTVVNQTVVHAPPAYVPPPRPAPAYTPPPRPAPTFSSPVRTAPSSWSAPSRPSTTSFSRRK